MTGSPTVDAHHHFWTAGSTVGQSWRQPEHAAIADDRLPAELAPQLSAAGVDRTVLMQAADSAAENRALAEFAARAPYVAGVVGWLPLAEPDRAGAELAALLALPMPVRGVRALIGTDPLAWAARPAALARFRELARLGLCWDVVPLTGAQVSAVVGVAEAVPELRIVVDHLARPPVAGGDWRTWSEAVTALATRPNVAVKLSVGVDVLTRWPAWHAPALRPYLAHALACFGPDRAMLASNWPVSALRVDYRTGWRDLTGLVAELAPAELARVTGGTATEWYRLATTRERDG